MLGRGQDRQAQNLILMEFKMAVEKINKKDIIDIKESLQEEKDFKKAMVFMEDDSLCYKEPKNKVAPLEFQIGEPITISKALLKKLKKSGNLS